MSVSASHARDMALEEAAKVADDQCLHWVGINADRYWQSRRIAGSIRALKEPVEEIEPFPQPRRNDGGKPCGECYLQPGETCDICGAVRQQDALALLPDELDPECGFPTDQLLRRIHLDVETRGRKNADFVVSVHHRNIVLSAVAHALRKRDLTWEEWLEACGWHRGSGTCECYRPGDCDGSCTHPEPLP